MPGSCRTASRSSRGSILDHDLLVEPTLREHAVEGVIHVAGYKYAGVSVTRPLHTYEQNVEGTRVVLAAMAEAGVSRTSCSRRAPRSTAPPTCELVTEDLPKRPASPYGESKLIGEWLLRDQAVATAASDAPLRHTSLRYFNVVGSADPAVYDTSPHNLFPLVFEALVAGRTPKIFGDDYDTPDGTNVRDYVHVGDIAAAHVVAAQRLAAGEPVEPAYNLGSQNGLSVKRDHGCRWPASTGIDFTPEIGAAPPRRPRPHRRDRRARGPRPRLGEPLLGRRDGPLRVGGPHRRAADPAGHPPVSSRSARSTTGVARNRTLSEERSDETKRRAARTAQPEARTTSSTGVTERVGSPPSIAATRAATAARRARRSPGGRWSAADGSPRHPRRRRTRPRDVVRARAAPLRRGRACSPSAIWSFAAKTAVTSSRAASRTPAS